MKRIHSLITLAVGIVVAPFCLAAPIDPAALAAAVEAALAARDLPALCALVDTAGLSEDDLKKVGPGMTGLLSSEGAKVAVDRLPDSIDLMAPRVINGKRIEITRAPLGIIRITSQQGRATSVATIPYVQTEAGFLLAGRKETDLGWTGPADRQIRFSLVEDSPKNPVAVSVRYNASGVEQTLKTSHHSGMVMGQHIEELVIAGLNEDFKGRLVLKDGKNEIYRSEPITGRTTFTYRRAGS